MFNHLKSKLKSPNDKNNKHEQTNEKTLSTVTDEGAIGWEVARIELLEKSEAKAWNVAKLLSASVIALSITLVCLFPLKTTEPFVIEVDQATGMTQVISIANTAEIPYSEMMDKYWLSQYVLSRETYDWRTLENDYIKTRELSMPNIFEPYANQFGQKDDSIERQLGDKKRFLVELQSVIPNGNGIATVRFVKKMIDTQTNAIQHQSAWTATIGYEYYPDFKVEEAKRLINPFGFKVTTYRVDPDIGG